MSIVALNKVTFVGLVADKPKVLDDLQAIGCLELIPLGAGGETTADEGPSPTAREALRFLLDCPQRRRQVRQTSRFDAPAVEREALELKTRLQDLHEERDFLVRRLRDFQPWGDFRFPSLEEMGGFRLWFYQVPHKDMKKVEAAGLCREVVGRDHRMAYVVVVSENEPTEMPVARSRLGAKPRRELEERLEDVELEIEDVQARRAYLTRWCYLFADSLDELEDRAARSHASTQTCDADPIFALQGWAPREKTEELRRYAADRGLVFEAAEPGPDDAPPTLLRNAQSLSVGEDLVSFYMTPGYATWDPSSAVFVSFTIFFAMILADAGYGLLLGLGLLLMWKRMGRSPTGRRFRPLGLAIVAASVAYGVIIGSYFGVSPSPPSLLARLKILDVNNSSAMMAVSVCVGAIHIIVASLMDARRLGWRGSGLPSLGWACVVGGGLVYAAGGMFSAPPVQTLAVVLMVGGAVLVFAFSGVGSRPLSRVIQGLLGLTKITSAFGDVLSYLRLFALGLASASLALAFNDMAGQIHKALPGFGVLFALLLLALGHGLNLLLGVSSGVIHGLRLNVIEFFNWGLKEEGRLFQPYKRKGNVTWNP